MGSNDERKEILQMATRINRTLRLFARVFPIGKPRARLWEGTASWVSGKPARAHRYWRKSLRAAERLEMAYEEGLTHFEIGLHGTNDIRRRHLEKARERFTALGAAYDTTRAESLLSVD